MDQGDQREPGEPCGIRCVVATTFAGLVSGVCVWRLCLAFVSGVWLLRHFALMRPILMLRHGETDWNAANRWQGWIDIPLNDRGRAQARERAQDLRAQMPPFVAVASSDLCRAHETATIIASAVGVTDVRVDRGFRERFGGDWQGLDRAEIGAQWPEQVEQWRSGILAGPPNAESIAAMLDRFDQALQLLHASLQTGPLLLVSHGGIQRAVSVRAGVHLTGVHGNLDGTWLQYDGERLIGMDTTSLRSDDGVWSSRSSQYDDLGLNIE